MLGEVSRLGCKLKLGVMEGWAAKEGVVEYNAEALGVVLSLASLSCHIQKCMSVWHLKL